jgi:MFS family permease
MNTERLWTKDFITVSVTNFLIYLIYYSLIVIIASYATDKFHASTSIAGLVASIFIIGMLIGRLGAGHIVEDIGSKRVLIVGTMFFIITSALYFAAINLPLLIIIRLLHGIAFGVASTAAGTMAAQIIPHNRRGEGISYYSMSVILGIALGPFFGILLTQHVDFNMIFIIISILAAISFAISFVVSEPSHRSFRQDQAKAVKSLHISNFVEYKVMPISVITLIIAFSYSGILAFISLYSKQIHLEEAASFFFLLYAIAVLISRPFSGRLFDARGATFVIYPCFVIFAVGMLLLSQVNHGITLLLAGALNGLGYGNFLSCGQAIAIKAAPPHRLGLATSTFFMFADLGAGVGPYLLGLLVPFTGYRGLYLLISIVILATIPLYYFLHGRKVSFE